MQPWNQRAASVAVAMLATALPALYYLPWEKDVRFGFSSSERPTFEAVSGPANGPGWTRRTVHVPAAGGAHIDSWLFLPAAATARPPVIVMAAGLGAQRDHRLPDFAQQFAAAGYAALLFDYRTWGGSEGEPRQQVHPWRFVSDYVTVVHHIQATDGLGGVVNPGQVVLWGSSYSGGHSLVTAARLYRQAATSKYTRSAASQPAHNTSAAAPVTPHHNSTVVAVVAMEPYTSAPLLVRASAFLNLCPRGRPLRPLPPAAPTSLCQGGTADDRMSCLTSPGAAGGSLHKVLIVGLRVAGQVVGAARVLAVAVSDLLRAVVPGAQAAYIPLVLPVSAVRDPCSWSEQQQAGTGPHADMGTNLDQGSGCRGWRALLQLLWPPLALSVLGDEDYAMFMSARPPVMLGGWRNLVCARMVWLYAFYHPLRSAADVQVPVLLVAGQQDTLTPPWSIKRAASKLAHSEYKELPGTHITLYQQPELIPTMLEFLHRTVPLT